MKKFLFSLLLTLSVVASFGQTSCDSTFRVPPGGTYFFRSPFTRSFQSLGIDSHIQSIIMDGQSYKGYVPGRMLNDFTGFTAGHGYQIARKPISVDTSTLILSPAVSFSNNANLASLTVSGVTLTPAFAQNTLSYSGSVANSVTSVTVSPTLAESHATVRVNNVALASGSSSSPIPLSVGLNNIAVNVLAQDNTTTKSYSLAITRADVGPTVFAVAPADMWYNSKGNLSYTSGGVTTPRYNAFATAKYSLTGATSVKITGLTTIIGEGSLGAGYATLTAYFNGTLLQTCTVSANYVPQDFNINLPNGGTGELDIICGTLSRAGDAGDIKGTVPLSVAVTGGSASKIPVTKTNSKVFIINGDSRSSGWGATYPEREAYIQLLKIAHPDWDFYVTGYGAKQAYAAFADQSAINATIAEITAAATGYTTVAIDVALGTNDFYTGVPVNTIQTAVQNGMTQLKAALPGARVFFQTPELQQAENQRTSDIRAAMAAITDLNGILAGPSLVDVSYVSGDGVHYTAAGQAIEAPLIFNFAISSNVTPTVSLTQPSDMVVGGTQNLTSTSTGSGSATYTSSNTSVATVSGSTVTAVGAGSSTITATYPAATGQNSASNSKTLTVAAVAPIYTTLEDKSFTSLGNWLNYLNGQGSSAFEVDNGVVKEHLIKPSGDISSQNATVYKGGVFTVGDKLKITVTGVNIVSGTWGVKVGTLSEPGNFYQAIQNGTTTLTINTAGFTDNYILISPLPSNSNQQEVFIGGIKIEKQTN